MSRVTHPKNLAVSLLLATILVAGFMTLWAIGVIACAILYQPFAQQVPYEQLVFTLDGQPLLETQTLLDRNAQTHYRTLGGEPLPGSELHDVQYPTSDLPPRDRTIPNHVSSWRWRIVGFLPSRPAATYWYLVDGLPSGAFFAGYQPESRQRIGYIGRNGFRLDQPPPDDRFPLDAGPGLAGTFAPRDAAGFGRMAYGRLKPPLVYLASEGGIVRVDLARQTVSKLDLPPGVISVGTYVHHTPVPDERVATHEQRLVVRLPEELRLFTMEGQPLRAIPLEPASRERQLWLLGTTTEDVILVGSEGRDPTTRYVDWIGPDERITRHETVRSIGPRHAGSSAAAAWLVTGLAPMPAVLLAGSVAGALENPQGDPPAVSEALATIIRRGWLPYGVLLVVSAISAVLCYRRHRQIAPDEALAWAVFVFVLGPPAWVGYGAHRQWPARARCETCGAVVPRDRATCLACAACFPPPRPKGIEVFA